MRKKQILIRVDVDTREQLRILQEIADARARPLGYSIRSVASLMRWLVPMLIDAWQGTAPTAQLRIPALTVPTDRQLPGLRPRRRSKPKGESK